MTVGICLMKLAVKKPPSPAGWRLRSSGELRILPKGESLARSASWKSNTYLFKYSVMRTCCTISALFSRINILNSDLEGVVLDSRYYGGSCLPQYIQDVPFRKPFNLQQYTFQVKNMSQSDLGPTALHTFNR